jgi:hypothetical protein
LKKQNIKNRTDNSPVFVFGKLLEHASLHHQVDHQFVLLVRSVAKVHAVRLAKGDVLEDEFLDLQTQTHTPFKINHKKVSPNTLFRQTHVLGQLVEPVFVEQFLRREPLDAVRLLDGDISVDDGTANRNIKRIRKMNFETDSVLLGSSIFSI